MAIDRRHLAMAAAVLAAVVVPVAAQPPQLAPEVERTTVAPEGRSFVSTPADERAAMERFTTYTFALARRDFDAAYAMLRPTLQAASPRAEWIATLHARGRTEEHTSELQSLMRHPFAVLCLHKKKLKQNMN